MKNELSRRKRVLVLIFAAAVLLTAPGRVFAAFSLSVRPYEGGNELRFGKVGYIQDRIDKQVVISITSDINKQYRLTNMIAEPLGNAQGVTIPQDNFIVYGLRGSNKYGTINVDHETSISPSRTYLYTSNQTGTSDSFTLIYSLREPQKLPSGTYRGRIIFSLEAINADQAPVTSILNVSAELEIENSMQISTLTGSSILSLNSEMQTLQNPQVSFSMSGDHGAQFRITQFLSHPLESQSGEQLPQEAVLFQISEAKKGSAIMQPTNLTPQQQRIYTSDQRGSQDSFLVSYSLARPQDLSAGKYRSQIKYFIESPTRTKQLESLDLEVQVARVFDLLLTPELGGSIEFRDLKPAQSPRTSVVEVEVRSNIGRPYQITQSILSPLANREGATIPEEYFTVREEAMENKGTLKLVNGAQVKTGDTVLYLSDRKGSSDKFRLIYELTPGPKLKAGDYATRITFTISEI